LNKRLVPEAVLVPAAERDGSSKLPAQAGTHTEYAAMLRSRLEKKAPWALFLRLLLYFFNARRS